ncbi:serine/threonine protein phosphatase [Desulfofundulus sp. TPOSR]|uniref:metallophosphoesterase family protein n=1 Tax=Desulfofundulus sp. TPOSR TaxID=2714340 RepID=UPI00140B191E|nr:metallophosphoesterase [Desulfofundulus sp. TPOSR]NHM27986.1 serine/threonine protein phosphatase [Desulfofundulus sp. TPOSR]
MRLLYFTDTHLRGTAPAARTDDFGTAVRDKLAEVVRLANELSVSAVLHGGDLFDLPEPGLGQVGEYLEILRGVHAPLYVVPGNHDVYGHNPATLPRTLLGFLARMGLVRLLDREPVYLEGGGVRLQLTGRGYHAGIDRRDPALDYTVEKRDCDFAVHVAHGMLLPRSVISSAPFLPAATAAEEVLEATGADYTLAGHYHMPWEIWVGGKVALNPGALVRLSAHSEEIARTPGVVVLECSGSGISHRYVPLECARPGEEVLSRAHLDAARAREESRAAFLAGLELFRGERFAVMEPEEVLREVLARTGAGPEVEAEAWRRFQVRVSTM